MAEIGLRYGSAMELNAENLVKLVGIEEEMYRSSEARRRHHVKICFGNILSG